MTDGVHMMTWVPRGTKERFDALAKAQGLSESALLKRLAEALIGTDAAPNGALPAVESVPSSGRLSIRLAADDLLLLRERARSRGMAAATYVSYLVRSHLRNLTPTPDVELKALNQAIAEVAAIGRNLNQVARALNSGAPAEEPSKGDLQAILRACSALRDSFKAVVAKNIESWEVGREKAAR